MNSRIRFPSPINEPVNSFAPGTAARASLKKELEAQAAEHVEIPIVIGGDEIFTGSTIIFAVLFFLFREWQRNRRLRAG